MQTLKYLFVFLALISHEAFSQNAIQNADKSVVWIVVKYPGNSSYGTGTGFMVAPEIIATNHHVVRGAQKMVAVTPNRTGEGKSYPIELIWDSPKSDLAILKAPGLNLPPLVLSEKLPTKGHHVTAIGYPGVADDVVDFKGVESTLTQGIVGRIIDSPIIDGGPNINMIQHSAAINSGNSGGPLVDDCGRVVGINEAKAKGRIEKDGKGYAINQSDGISLALHVSALTNGLKISNISYSSTDIDCQPGQSLPPPNASFSNWGQLIGISIALLLAGGAFFFSIRKKEVIRETFTQFQRRKTESNVATNLEVGAPKSWRLKGEYQDGRDINIVLTTAMFSHGPLYIGRDSNSCKVLIDDPSVSRRHAVLELNSGGLRISDPGSTNGTWLDREKIGARSIQIRYGQILTFGKVRVKLEGAF
jgi:Trypsin-like peptidase domain/FHA domain